MNVPLNVSGSAFNGNTLQAHQIKSNLYEYQNQQIINQEKTNYVSLTEWCNRNFISKRIGRNLLAKHLLIGQKLFGQWWVCANQDCLLSLLDYLGVEQLIFDANNQ